MVDVPVVYEVDEVLFNSGCRYCAALYLVPETLRKSPAVDMYTYVSASKRNGTMTYVRRKGELYALTAWHVIEQLRKCGSHDLWTLVNKPCRVVDRFIQCDNNDLALAPLSGDVLAASGKTPIDYDNQDTVPTDSVEFGVAMGFPGDVVEKQSCGRYDRIMMPCATVVAPRVRGQDPVMLQFFAPAEIVKSMATSELAGMSGGPVFWTNGKKHSVIGVVCESLKRGPNGGSIAKEGELWIRAVRITPERLDLWIGESKRSET